MSGIQHWLTGLGGGGMVAFLYFFGLWFTVQRLAEATFPLGMYATSLVIRVSLLGIAFAFVLHSDWRQLVGAAIGFLVVRYVAVFSVVRAKSAVA